MYTKSYREIEQSLINHIVDRPDFITASTYEVFNISFILGDPYNNQNGRSNYDYADEFFKWMLTGEHELSSHLLDINPWVNRFVDKKGLPDSFSSSYGWKLKEQEDMLINELRSNRWSRRAYASILQPADHVIFTVPKSTMEFPCTIGLHFFIRDEELILTVNMRSNNVWAVLPYDVYNFTMYQQYIADKLGIKVGRYIHQINNAHIFKGDVRRIQESRLNAK